MTAVPDKIGKYELAEEIGRGSMGTVYSAQDLFSNRLVAIKVAHPQYIDQSDEGVRFRKLFFNEAQAAGHLHHPNILQIFDADVEGDLCYIVMEYVHQAQTLKAYGQPDTLLPIREVVGIVYKIAKALDYAHRQGIVHRDVKPSNILLTQERDIKLADFSIAMINRTDVKSTQVTGYLGSPLYMSPEQILDQTLTGSTDIFSLGAVLYQLLTGAYPFKADTLNRLNYLITTEDPTPVDELRTNLPEGLGYAVGRMLKKKPDLRYATGLNLAADLAVIFEDLDTIPDEEALRNRFDHIKRLRFFKGFSDTDLWELIRACAWQSYPVESIIIKEGEADHSFYIVLSGVVAIEKSGRVVDHLQEGDCFGEMGYLTRAQRTANAIARTDVSLMKINASTIDAAAESAQLRFLKVFVETLIGRLRSTTAALAAVGPV